MCEVYKDLEHILTFKIFTNLIQINNQFNTKCGLGIILVYMMGDNHQL